MQETPVLPPFLSEEGACQSYIRTPAFKVKRDIFFPPDEIGGVPNAKAMKFRDEAWGMFCRTCPVNRECFDYAMEHEEYGNLAGTTMGDRHRARRDPELMEFGRRRLEAGYVPFPSILCMRRGCPEVVAKPNQLCRRCKGILKREANKRRKR